MFQEEFRAICNGGAAKVNLMKKNPNREVLHTVLVEKNGYIHSLLFGTPFECEGYEFYGDAAYRDLIQTATVYPHVLRIPPRSKEALTGSAFVEKIKNLPLEEREAEIYKEISYPRKNEVNATNEMLGAELLANWSKKSRETRINSKLATSAK